MKNENQKNDDALQPPTIDFLSELATMHEQHQQELQKFSNLSQRVSTLEATRKPAISDDPMEGIMLMIGLVVVAQMVLPLLVELLQGRRGPVTIEG